MPLVEPKSMFFLHQRETSFSEQRLILVIMSAFQYRVGDASNEGGLSVGVGAKGGAIQMTLYLIHMPTGSHPLRSSKSHY